jgi:glutaredoxin
MPKNKTTIGIVEVFTTKECHKCPKLIAFLDKHKIKYIKRMVDKDPDIETEALIYNIFSVPALKIGERVLRTKDVFTRADLNESTVLAFLQGKPNKASEDIKKRDTVPELRRATGLGTWFFGTYASKVQPSGYQTCLNCKHGQYKGSFCKKYQALVSQIEVCNDWEGKTNKRANAIKNWPMSGKWRYSNHAVQQFDILANIEEKHVTKKIPKGQTSLTDLSQKYTLEYKRKIARKIKNRFAWATRRLSTTYTPKVSEIFTQAKPYDQWSIEVQAVIMNQLKNEGEGMALMVDKDVYGFGMFTEMELAGSYWEERARDFVDKYIGSGEKCHANAGAMERMPYHYNKIIQIENMIKQRGYDPAQPLMIECFPPRPKNNEPASFFQIGGHHRLQAIRNLIKSGDLPKDFQFPVLCTFEKDRWGLESENAHWKRQSEVKKKWFDEHPGKRDFPGDW